MGKLIDLTGQRFGRLVVLGRDGSDKYGSALWRCRCNCGNEVLVTSSNLRRTNSCGCLRRELVTKRDTAHGQRFTRLYRVWQGMKTRCNTPSSTSYRWYGARGITVCDEWMNNFESFRSWALTHGYRDDLTIDRINVDGNYEPDNCRWATVAEQQHNKRDSR